MVKARRTPRRERVKKEKPEGETAWGQYDYKWLAELANKQNARKILEGHPPRFFMSIRWDKGPEPVSGFLPCTVRRTTTHVFYGFLFAEHRDAFYQHQSHNDARKVFREEMLEVLAEAHKKGLVR